MRPPAPNGCSPNTPGTVLVPPEHAAAALEIMSRFAVDPRWLAYIPPTISPCRTTELEHLLEYPPEAFDYYRDQQITPRNLRREAHGLTRHHRRRQVPRTPSSRSSASSPTNPVSATPAPAATSSQTPSWALRLSNASKAAVTQAGLWDTLNTDWLIMDAEIMPWSLKADGLLRAQYASTGAAADLNLKKAHAAIQQAASRGTDPEPLQQMADRFQLRSAAVEDYIASYRRYCWNVDELSDIKVAPFHIMASEAVVHHTKDHQWHLDMGRALNAADSGLFMPTQAMVVELNDPEQEAKATQWWERITQLGAEGMVVKPLEFTVTHNQQTVQPAIKVPPASSTCASSTGRSTTSPRTCPGSSTVNLRFKRSLAIREFALGIEGLQRFVNDETLPTRPPMLVWSPRPRIGTSGPPAVTTPTPCQHPGAPTSHDEHLSTHVAGKPPKSATSPPASVTAATASPKSANSPPKLQTSSPT